VSPSTGKSIGSPTRIPTTPHASNPTPTHTRISSSTANPTTGSLLQSTSKFKHWRASGTPWVLDSCYTNKKPTLYVTGWGQSQLGEWTCFDAHKMRGVGRGGGSAKLSFQFLY
jgi:hypothetical protein